MYPIPNPMKKRGRTTRAKMAAPNIKDAGLPGPSSPGIANASAYEPAKTAGARNSATLANADGNTHPITIAAASSATTPNRNLGEAVTLAPPTGSRGSNEMPRATKPWVPMAARPARPWSRLTAPAPTEP